MKIDELAEKYAKIRDKVSELEAAHKEKLAPFKEALEKIEVHMLTIFNEQGTENAKTAFGTFYKAKQTSATVASKEDFRTYILSHDRWDLVDMRAQKTAVAEFVETSQEPPPGVNWTSRFTVNFRKG
jgi:nitrogen regulatory protein PII